MEPLVKLLTITVFDAISFMELALLVIVVTPFSVNFNLLQNLNCNFCKIFVVASILVWNFLLGLLQNVNI